MPVTYTITLTDAQNKVLLWIRDRLNASRESSVTAAELVQAQVPLFLDPHVREFDKTREAALVESFRAANEATKIEAETTLKGR